MTIKIGDHLPDVTFRIMGEDGPQPVTSRDFFKAKKIVLIGVPGAFTPTCHGNHLPGFLKQLDAFHAKGIDVIAVTAANDVFVMNAWAKASDAVGKITFLADGNGDFPKAIGLAMDGTAFGLGHRSQRYAMVVDDGFVTHLNVEEGPGKAEISGADALLTQL